MMEPGRRVYWPDALSSDGGGDVNSADEISGGNGGGGDVDSADERSGGYSGGVDGGSSGDVGTSNGFYLV